MRLPHLAHTKCFWVFLASIFHRTSLTAWPSSRILPPSVILLPRLFFLHDSSSLMVSARWHRLSPTIKAALPPLVHRYPPPPSLTSSTATGDKPPLKPPTLTSVLLSPSVLIHHPVRRRCPHHPVHLPAPPWLRHRSSPSPPWIQIPNHEFISSPDILPFTWQDHANAVIHPITR
jgi:hypothetical protein